MSYIAAQDLASGGPLANAETVLQSTFETVTFVVTGFFFLIGVIRIFRAVWLNDASRDHARDERYAQRAQVAAAPPKRVVNMEVQNAIASRILEMRGEFADWLIDEAFALRLYIWEADRLSLPGTVTGLEHAERAYQLIERLKGDNAAVIASLANEDVVAKLDATDYNAAERQFQEMRDTCNALNERVSLSPFYLTGYRVKPETLAEISHSHRIGQD